MMAHLSLVSGEGGSTLTSMHRGYLFLRRAKGYAGQGTVPVPFMEHEVQVALLAAAVCKIWTRLGILQRRR